MSVKNCITILGSGTSTGIPLPGCHCQVCTSSNPKNKRLRSSLLLQTKKEKTFLIDTGPDLREQLLRYKIEHVDSIIITHTHADHIHGLDDARGLCFFPKHHSIKLYTSLIAGKELKRIFSYVFERNQRALNLGGEVPLLDLNELDLSPYKTLTTSLEGEDFTFFLLPHGLTYSLGLRYKTFAYLSDCHAVPEHVIGLLTENPLDLLIIDCTQRSPHKTHLTLDTFLALLPKFKNIKRIGIIHLNHQFDHEKLTAELREHSLSTELFVTYDGQRLEF